MTDIIFPGEDLRTRREELGLTRGEVFRKLRIAPDWIAALEDGALNRLPETTYVIGFVKSYCEFLDLPPDKYIDCIRESARENPTLFQPVRRTRKSEPSPWVRDALAWTTVTIILALGWATYWVLVEPWTERSAEQVEAVTVDMRIPDVPDGR